MTRASESARGAVDPLARLLRDQGAEAVAMPCVRFEWPEDTAALDAKLRALSDDPADALVLSSPQAVARFVSRMESIQKNPESVLQRMPIAVAGAGTARSLKQFEYLRVIKPKVTGAAGLAEALKVALGPLLRGARIALPRAQGGSPEAEALLTSWGAEVDAFVLYRTETERPDAQGVQSGLHALRAGQIDAITFGSGSAVTGFCDLAGGEAKALAEKPKVACMGEKCASVARDRGLRVDAIADGDFEALVDALARC
ncbi:MAG: uroporphyrinogen-III synthase [Deltaproteobacteria bacterium]|nr:uroporphyrinogen-III synthase [Deltaproteobacteria bacterium]